MGILLIFCISSLLLFSKKPIQARDMSLTVWAVPSGAIVFFWLFR
ncbi:hypothetical protein SAMN05421747_101202 [Parapedobacter composti]|uniref:Uncharacterized protein n=1 Tax=Parapedobacter composti TaxID=623281 RepID=A0A1I1E5L2_9SPHI|nr:hypothetical protein SAMN05421747_101202 [Parapedobacter composti]